MRLRAILFYDRRDIPCERWVCVRQRVRELNYAWRGVSGFSTTTWEVGKPHYRWMTRR
jgi:hypothetical protein